MWQIVTGIFRSIKFTSRLNEARVFSRHNPSDMLLVIKEFIRSEYPTYNENLRFMYRTPKQNADVLSSLVDTYLSTKSETTLNQILEVVKVTVSKGAK